MAKGENLNVLINLATITMVAENKKAYEEEAKNLNEAWDCSNEKS